MLSFATSVGPAPAPPDSVGLRALGFLAGDQSALDRFLQQSGLRPYDLRRSPTPPEHLAAALDFLITNEPMLVKFAGTVDLPPEAIYDARRAVGRVPRPGRGYSRAGADDE